MAHLPKPLHPLELRPMLSIHGQASRFCDGVSRRGFLKIGALSFDRAGRQVSVAGDLVDLPRKELAAFECLLERRGRLTPKSALLDHLYGIGADVEDSAVEVHISRLRKRLRVHGVEIKTARGLGYMLVERK